MMEDFEKVNLN